MAYEDIKDKGFDCRSTEEVQEAARKGGIASGESRRARKTLREELIALLSEDGLQERISIAILQKALEGDVKAFTAIRDTIGEKPEDMVKLGTEEEFKVNINVIRN